MAINSDVITFSIYTTNQTIAQDYYFIYKVDEKSSRKAGTKGEGRKRKARIYEGRHKQRRQICILSGAFPGLLQLWKFRNVLRMEIDEHLLGLFPRCPAMMK